MAFDDDGSVNLLQKGADGTVAASQGVGPQSGGYVNASTAEAESINDEDVTDGINQFSTKSSLHYTIMFPEKREVDGIYIAVGSAPSNSWSDYTTDTTNGSDGNWSDFSIPGNVGDLQDDYRDKIVSQALSNIIAIRHFQGRTQVTANNVDLQSFHAYGTITPGETPDRLLYLDPDTGDAVFTKPLDFGDVPRGQTTVDTFKVKNNSGSLTANTVQTTAEALTGTSGSWYTYSLNNIDFSATLGLGNIGPGATTLVYIKQIIPGAEPPALHSTRTKLNVASWS